MRIDHNLNEYDELIPQDQKLIFKYAIWIFTILTSIFVILTIFFNSMYTLIVGYAIGSLVNSVLFYITQLKINSSYYGDLDKVTRKLSITYKVAYLLTFFLLVFIFKTIYIIISTILGLLLIKIAIILSCNAMKKELR